MAYQQVITQKAEFLIFPKNIEFLVKVGQNHGVLGLLPGSQIFFYQLYFHVVSQRIVKFIVYQKAVWTHFEILYGKLLPLLYRQAWYAVVLRQGLASFDDQIFNDFGHGVCVFATLEQLILQHDLDVVYRVRIVQQPHELQDQDLKTFDAIVRCGGYVSETACRERRGYKIQRNDILLLKIIDRHLQPTKPGRIVVSVSTNHYLYTRQQMKDLDSLYGKLQHAQILLNSFDLHDCHSFPKIAEYLIHLLRRVKHGLYPRYLDHEILQRVNLVLLITQEDGSNCYQDFKEYRERQIIHYYFAETTFWYTLFVDKTNK